MPASVEIPDFIKRIAIVDDNPEAREMMGECVADANLEPIFEDPRDDPIEKYLSRIMKKSDAAIFDHHLRPGNYASFDGAAAVAYAYKNCFPALLLTIYAINDIKEIRPLRRNIPALISGIEVEIDIIKSGINQCLDEFKDHFSPERKPHRTLVRITEVYEENLNVIVPAWDQSISLNIPREFIPDELRRDVSPGDRFTAYVNIGASSFDQIYFEKFDIARVPNGEYSKLIRS